MNREFNSHTFSVLFESDNKSHKNSSFMNDETKQRFFKFPNPNHTSFPHRRLRVADILLVDEDYGGADSMHRAGDTLPPRHGYPSAKCYSPWRLVARLMAALRITKDHKAMRRRQRMQNEVRDSNTTSLPMNVSSESEETGAGQLHRDDTSFKLGVGCGLLYMIAASKNELGKMVELRKETEMLLKNVKGVLQSKDVLLKPLKQQSDVIACSITDVQEVSSSHSHHSVHTKTSYVQPEPERSARFLEYHVNKQDKFAEEINELQAEFEVELERLQLYLDREADLEGAEQEKDKVNAKDYSCSKSHSSSVSEIIMEPQGASADVFFGVPPVELERRLHELLQARLQERITELESALECTTMKLMEKDTEITWWKDTARLVSQHVPETSRFTFRLDPDAGLKLSQVV